MTEIETNKKPGADDSGVRKSVGALSEITSDTFEVCPCAAGKSTEKCCGFDKNHAFKNLGKVLDARGALEPAEARNCNELPPLKRCHSELGYNDQTGEFISKKNVGGVRVGDQRGTLTNGYIQIYIDYRPYRAHRLAFKMHYGRDPVGFIDHINGDRADNRICNLREVTPWQNSLNRHAPVKSNTGHLGVSRLAGSGKYLASLGVGGEILKLGAFDNLCCAVAARKHAFNILVGTPDNDNGGKV